MSFMALDVVQFVPVNCLYDKTFDHFDGLLLETLAPILLLLLAEIGSSVQKWRAKVYCNTQIIISTKTDNPLTWSSIQ